MEKKDEAHQVYLPAKEGYKSLGDKSKVEELQAPLERFCFELIQGSAYWTWTT